MKIGTVQDLQEYPMELFIQFRNDHGQLSLLFMWDYTKVFLCKKLAIEPFTEKFRQELM